MKPIHLIKFAAMLCLTMIITNCSVENSNPNQETAQISVDLRAFQGAYDNLTIDIQDVLIKVIDDESVPGCWLSLNATKGIYNLSEHDDGSFIGLVDHLNIPSGMIYEVQLVLGTNNSIIIDGEYYPLATPSVHQLGRTTRVETEFTPNDNFEVLIDFDVDESILLTNSPDYIILKPTLSTSIYLN